MMYFSIHFNLEDAIYIGLLSSNVTTQTNRQQILSSLGFSFRVFPRGFKTRSLERGFHTLIRNSSFPSFTDGDLTIHPLGGQASSLAHCLVYGSDTICNSPSPSLAYIVLFRLPLSGFFSKF